MSPPPDVRVTVSSLALATLACATYESPKDDNQTRPAESSTSTGSRDDVPSLATPGTNGFAVPADQRTCSVGELSPSSSLSAEIAAFGVRHADFARRILYSWTTAEQVQELRDSPTLLTRAATAGGEAGRAAEVIQRNAGSDALAALLAAPRFENKRFGWSNPWATAQGFGDESYGNHLLRITLREQAWVGSLIVDKDSTLAWAFADVQGNPVAAAEVLGSPERLAAVYFVDLRGTGCGSAGYVGSAFREYFLCNEAMLESFALYTDDVRAEVDRSIRALQGLQQALLVGSCTSPANCWPDAVLAEWSAARAGAPTLDARYLAALAFPSAQYLPTQDNLSELLALLRNVPFEAPLLHTYPE